MFEALIQYFRFDEYVSTINTLSISRIVTLQRVAKKNILIMSLDAIIQIMDVIHVFDNIILKLIIFLFVFH